MLTSGLPDADRRMPVLGILSILHELHTRRGSVAAPALHNCFIWLNCQMNRPALQFADLLAW